LHSDAGIKLRVPEDNCHQQLQAVEIDRIANENECQIGQLVSENPYNTTGDVDKVSSSNLNKSIQLDTAVNCAL